MQAMRMTVKNLSTSFLIRNRKSELNKNKMQNADIISAKKFIIKGAFANPNCNATRVTSLGITCKYPAYAEKIEPYGFTIA
jgi:hypothetical protein